MTPTHHVRVADSNPPQTARPSFLRLDYPTITLYLRTLLGYYLSRHIRECRPCLSIEVSHNPPSQRTLLFTDFLFATSGMISSSRKIGNESAFGGFALECSHLLISRF
jgi:hypothetical protein